MRTLLAVGILCTTYLQSPKTAVEEIQPSNVSNFSGENSLSENILDRATPEEVARFVDTNPPGLKIVESSPPRLLHLIADDEQDIDIYVDTNRNPHASGEQTLSVRQGDVTILGPWKISSGAIIRDPKDGVVKDHRTPSGDYPVVAMLPTAFSAKYENAPMMHAIFFKKGGPNGKHLVYAIHGSNDVKDLGRPASHGCVRLSPAHAATLYSLVESHGPEHTQIHVAE